MPVPVTTFDEVYSDPAATAVSWEETSKLLAEAELFWVSTVRADGRPHVTPVVAVWTEDAVWFSTGDTEQKFLNMKAHPHVVLTTGCNHWDQGVDVVVEGEAVRVTDQVTLERIAAVFRIRWDGRWQFTARDGMFRGSDGSGGACVFAVHPTKVFAHAKGDPFGATRHKFMIM
jgi:uncharacterized pyridoxamine 5'-phosphate oxidase family protein